jgi:hypothetical protein
MGRQFTRSDSADCRFSRIGNPHPAHPRPDIPAGMESTSLPLTVPESENFIDGVKNLFPSRQAH